MVTHYENPRGCGTRKAGGFYLVIDAGEVGVCKMLPIPIPHESFFRGFKWVRWGDYEKRKCKCCWLGKLPDDEKCLLNWVGTSFYKRSDGFVKEAHRIGISRRVAEGLAMKVQIGKTPILLAHKEGKQIFMAYIPQRLEYIAKNDDSEEKLREMEERGITVIKVKGINDMTLKLFEN